MNTGFNYDKIIKNVGLKYVVPIIAAKRAESLKNIEELEAENGGVKERNYVTRALNEIENKKIKIKNIDNLYNLEADVK